MEMSKKLIKSYARQYFTARERWRNHRGTYNEVMIALANYKAVGGKTRKNTR